MLLIEYERCYDLYETSYSHIPQVPYTQEYFENNIGLMDIYKPILTSAVMFKGGNYYSEKATMLKSGMVNLTKDYLPSLSSKKGWKVKQLGFTNILDIKNITKEYAEEEIEYAKKHYDHDDYLDVKPYAYYSVDKGIVVETPIGKASFEVRDLKHIGKQGKELVYTSMLPNTKEAPSIIMNTCINHFIATKEYEIINMNTRYEVEVIDNNYYKSKFCNEYWDFPVYCILSDGRQKKSFTLPYYHNGWHI